MFRRLLASFLLLALCPLAALALAVALEVRQADVRSGVLILIGLTGAFVSVTALVLASSLARRYLHPLRALTAAAQRLGSGENNLRTFVPGRDELGQLGQALNQMSDKLGTRIEQLEEDRQQLRTILSGMVEGVVAMGPDQDILFANDRAIQLLDFPTRNAVGRRIWEVVRQRSLLDLLRRAFHSSQPFREELAWSGTQARSLTVHVARLPGALPRGAVLVIHDTTELRRLERLRQEFIANVSHELKTPLSVIKVCVETLMDGAGDEPMHRARFLGQIANQSERLHALILDMLSLARIESGDELFDLQSIPVAQTLRSALDRHRDRAEARNQTLQLLGPDSSVNGSSAGPDEDDIAAWADEEALDQILDNLLDNAVKYTPDGGRIEVAWHSDDREIALEVRDTGIGIPEADLPRIFERFYRVDRARSREMGGTGLGLSIVKHLVSALHGSVRAASRLGEGTTFTVRLPRAPSH